MKDETLSELIAKTSCDPGFARDLLNHHDWNLGLALKSYYRMNNIIVEKDLSPFSETTISFLDCDNRLQQEKIFALKNGSENLKSNSTLTSKDVVSSNFNKCSSEPSLSSQSSGVCESSIVSSPSKLTFNFINRNDLFLERKLSRGISRASDNENLVCKARSEIAQDFKTSTRGSRLMNLDKFIETPDFTFILPDINVHQDDFCEFLKKDLIEKSTLLSLESAKRLNWWSEICNGLYPLVTSGDGNCLLHAASLGMWGFHDRNLILRRALHILLSNSSYTKAFYRRWRWQTHFQNSKAGLSFSEHEWEIEWENVLRMASTEPRSKNSDSLFDINGGKKEPNEYEEKAYIYESLEEIHIFVLAHVLRRPIIVIADVMLKDSKGEAFFPIPFGGIYLPLECSDDCLKKSPLCLTYDAAHFSALVAMNKEVKESSNNSIKQLPLAIPLMDVDHNILPLHFAIDPGQDIFSQKTLSVEHLFEDLAKTFVLTEQDKIELLKKYFDILSFSHKKANCVETKIESKIASAITDKRSQTLPSNFGLKSVDFTDIQVNNEKEKSKTLYAKQFLQRPFASFGRMSKRLKKNIGHLARRSTSFRLVTKTVICKNGKDNISKNLASENALPIKQNSIPSQPLTPVLVKNNETANNFITTENESDRNNYYRESIINTENSIFYCDTYVLAAKLYTDKRHLYYDDMIKNYLNTARVRFFNEKQMKKSTTVNNNITTNNDVISSTTISSTSLSSSTSSLSSSNSTNETPQNPTAKLNQLTCVSPNCKSLAKQSTNYLCKNCFEEQKKVFQQNDYSASQTNKLSAAKSKVDTESFIIKDENQHFSKTDKSPNLVKKFESNDSLNTIEIQNNHDNVVKLKQLITNEKDFLEKENLKLLSEIIHLKSKSNFDSCLTTKS